MREYQTYLSLVEKALSPALAGDETIPERLLAAMDYSLSAGGKRLRPVLLLAAAEMAGGDVETAMPFACALEMIHTYSLIHDDLPAMDNDDLRRGKPTNHKVFGEDLAILAGDGLLSAAMERMLQAACSMAPDFSGVRAAEVIARRAGVTGMVAGQTVDVLSEGSAPDAERLLYIHAHKTADLLTAPLEAGLLLAHAGEEQLEAVRAYGYHFGMAFQMTDDILDVIGDETVLGKPIGSDAEQGKLTWVTLKGLEETRLDAQHHVQAAAAALEKLPWDTGFLGKLAADLLTRVK